MCQKSKVEAGNKNVIENRISDMILVGKKKAEISRSGEKMLKNKEISLISRSKKSESAFQGRGNHVCICITTFENVGQFFTFKDF